MDFFEAQDQARRRSYLLVGLFLAAVVSIIVGLYVVVLTAGGLTMGIRPGFDPGLFAVVALGTGGLIFAGSAFRTAQLRKGGTAVASLLGGRPVDPGTSDPAERRLMNVVDEMSVASGVPAPAVYVLDREPGINAFAAGHSIHDAAVAVTRGTLEELNRDELQGVIAHEFSHILNGDMRLNVRLVGLLFGILLLAVVGRGLVRGQMFRSRRGGGNQVALIGVALLILGYIGVFFGKLIKAAVSRQREFLADAAAVQFTRNPSGIAGALRKIAQGDRGARIQDHHGEELSHLFFANGVGGAFARAMATHPPIQERIRRIDPALTESPAERVGVQGAPDPAPPGHEGVSGITDSAPDRGWTRQGVAARGTGAESVLAMVGAPTSDHLARASRLVGEMPDAVKEAAHEPEGAQAVILGLLGHRGADGASGVERATRLGGTVRDRLEALVPLLDDLTPRHRLALVDLSLPALGRLDEPEARSFRDAVKDAIRMDGQMGTFEFALVHILWKHLPGSGQGVRRRRSTVRRIGQLRRELELVLSAMARAGAEDESDAMEAFLQGVDTLDRELSGLTFRAAKAAGFPELDEALSRLEQGSLKVRRRVLGACAAVVLADDRVQPRELELLRAVAESLELPLPPLGDGPVPS